MTKKNTFVLQTKSKPLYEITSDFLEIIELQTAVDDDGVPTVEDLSFLKDTEESIKYDFETKVLNTGRFIKNLGAEISEIEGIEAAWKAALLKVQRELYKRKNRVKRIKEYLKKNMELLDIKKIDSIEVTVSVRKNGGQVPVEWLVDDMEKRERVVPSEFKKTVIDDVKINRALRDGQVLEYEEEGQTFVFAKLGERGTHLTVS